MSKDRGQSWQRDPRLPIVKTPHGKKEHEEHNIQVGLVATAIFMYVSHRINFDHVNILIPREPISLEYKGKRYDIAYLDRHGNRVLVEIKIAREQN